MDHRVLGVDRCAARTGRIDGDPFWPALATSRFWRACCRTSTGYQTTAPKAASRRTIDLSAPAVEILRQHLAATGPAPHTALLFTRPDGGVLRQQHIQVAWQKAREEVGLPGVHVHDLRHASLTLVAQTGASTKEIMARGGHSSLRAAMIYQHNAAERGPVIAASMTATADAAAPDRGIATP